MGVFCLIFYKNNIWIFLIEIIYITDSEKQFSLEIGSFDDIRKNKTTKCN